MGKRCTCLHARTHTHTQNAIHLAIKKNTIFPFAGTWVDLEDIVLNEISISHTGEDKHCMISVICGI